MKHLTILLLIYINIHTVFSQESDEQKSPKSFITLSAGLASYTIFGSQVDHLEASYPGSKPKINRKNGLRIDVGYKRLITNRFFINTGLSIIQKGGSQTGTGFVDNARLEKTYFQIPLLAGLQGVKKKYKLGIETGVSLNAEMASGKSTTGSGWISNSYKQRTFIPALLVGTFLMTKLNSNYYLNIRLLYEIDLIATVERTNSSDETFQIKTQGFSATFGLTKPGK